MLVKNGKLVSKFRDTKGIYIFYYSIDSGLWNNFICKEVTHL